MPCHYFSCIPYIIPAGYLVIISDVYIAVIQLVPFNYSTGYLVIISAVYLILFQLATWLLFELAAFLYGLHRYG